MADKDSGNVTDNKATPTLEDLAEESKGAESDIDALFTDDFFADLDKSVNAGILSDTAEETTKDPTLVAKSGSSDSNKSESKTVEELQKEINILSKRYEGSSSEGKKLNKLVTDVKPFLPLLDAMRKDPNLTQHIEGYFEGGGQAKTIQQRLGLPEEFVYDSDEAMTDPTSDSAKLLKATINEAVRGELSTGLKAQREQDKRQKLVEKRKEEEQAFKDEHPDENWDEMEEFMNEHVLSLEDIKLIKDRDSRDSTISDSVRKAQMDKMKKTQNVPSSLASTASSAGDSKSPGERLVGLLNSLDSVDSVFNN